MFALRMTAIAGPALAVLSTAAQAGEPVLRIAVLKFGTVNWELDVIRHHGLDRANGALVSALRAASRQAKDFLRDSDAEWDRLRPQMKVEDDATFQALREGFRAGIPGADTVDMASVQAMFALLAELGGAKLVGKATTVEPGLFHLN